ncbi:MAG: serine/threonine-protein kinase [Aggregatilineales bacterium]
MTASLQNRVDINSLIIAGLRFGFVGVAAVSLFLYGVYFQAAFSYWEAHGGLPGLLGIPMAVQLPVMVIIEVTLALTFWGASIYLLVRRPDSVIVLLTAMVGFMMPVRVAFMQVIPLQALPSWYPPAAQVVFLAVFATLSYVVVALFPDGVVRPRWVRWWLLARLPIILNYVTNAIPVLNQLYIYIDIVMFGALMVAQYQRFKQDRISIERQQTKWILLGMGFGLGFFFVRRLADMYLLESFPELYAVIYSVSRVAVLSIPVAITLALLRYRLYDVDWVLNRSIVYALITLLIAGLLAFSLFISQVVLSQFVNTSDARLLMTVLSALLVAWLYQPVRSQVQRFVDQRFFRLRLPPKTFKMREAALNVAQSWKGIQLDELVIGDLVARGSIGQVYTATHRDQRVAVKLLPQETHDDELSQQLIQREMTFFRNLKHPNICQMLGSGLHQGAPYIIMEYVEGEELEDVLEVRGVLTLEETRLIIRDIAAALDYLHEHNILHCDVKPRNIILQDVRAVLTDFGTARMLSGTQSTGHLLLTTPDYTAPEQLREDGHPSPATDVYSLGVVAYRMLVGQKPFEGSLRQKMLAIVHTPARDPRDLNSAIPRPTAEAILRALDKDPARRFATASEFARAL